MVDVGLFRGDSGCGTSRRIDESGRALKPGTGPAVASEAYNRTMSIRTWLSDLFRGSDEAALERAEELSDESPEEQVYLSGDIDAVKADVKTGFVGGATERDFERLGE